MLISSCHKFFLVQIKLCSLMFASPVEWHSKKRRFRVVAGLRLQIYKCVILSHCFHVFFLFGNAMYHNHSSITIRLVKWNNMLILMSSVFFHYGTWERRAETVVLMNSLLKFERAHLYSSLSGGVQLVEKLVILVSPYTTISFPITIGLSLLVKPCLPPYLGSVVFNCEQQLLTVVNSTICSSTGHFVDPAFAILQLNFSLLAAWCWAVSASTSMMHVTVLFVTTRCLLTYMGELRRNNLPKRVYREVQILSTLLNKVQQDTILPCLQVICTAAGIISLYSVVNLHKVIPLPMLLFCGVTIGDVSCTYYFVFGAAARIFVQSRVLPGKWKGDRARRTTELFGKKLNRVYHRSCAPIKIRCGSLNFISMLTPLKFINFLVVTTVKLSVMWRRGE